MASYALDPGHPAPPVPTTRLEGRRLAHERVLARRRRARMIRRRVVALALALFVAVWSTILIRLASGHDPALSRKAAAVVSANASSAASSDPTSSASASASDSGATSGQAASAPATMSTGQS